MAIINLLKADYTGALGKTVGQRWKNRSVVKSRVDGKAPPSRNQTRNVRAFECANRLASWVAKNAWDYFKFPTDRMLRHNAMASFFKPMVKNHLFEPQNLIDAVPEPGRYSISKFYYAWNRRQFYTTFTQNFNYIPRPKTYQMLVVFKENGEAIGGVIRTHQASTIVISRQYEWDLKYYAIHLLSSLENDKPYLYDFSFAECVRMDYSQGEIPLPDRWIDGAPMFTRALTSTITISQTTAGVVYNKALAVPAAAIPGVINVISYEITFDGNPSSGYIMQVGNGYINFWLEKDDTGLYLCYSSMGNGFAFPATTLKFRVILTYTKGTPV